MIKTNRKEFFLKLAYVRKLPNGKYRVFSEKGKNMGTYDTKEEANKRLGQIEYFKKQANKELTYSSIMRTLRHNHEDQVEPFMKKFKEEFDESLIEGADIRDAEKIALLSGIKAVGLDLEEEGYYVER